MNNFILLTRAETADVDGSGEYCFTVSTKSPSMTDNDVIAWKIDPSSLKELLKRNNLLESVKVVLSWLINTIAGTIKLPPHYLKHLMKLLTAFLQSCYSRAQSWSCIVYWESCAA